MDFKQYTRRPFVVEAVEITEENLEEVAALIGGIREANGQRWIILDRSVVPNISRAEVGWYLTRLNDKYHCYAPKVFNAQFVLADAASSGQVDL